MKIFTNTDGGRESGGYTMPGMTLTGPLLLSGTVTLPAEAIHKQYVDDATDNLDASDVTTGVLASARLPAFTGAVTSSVGSSALSLNSTGVIAGDYAKVTVGLDGRVTSGSSLTEADLPSFDWSKISLDKPTSLTGYGIADALRAGSGAVTGFLTLAADPTTNTQLATKQYVDTKLSNTSNVATGDIVTRTTPDTPVGFLRCNGAELSKSTFNNLYTVIGDRFSFNNYTPAGGGQPWQQQYQFNNSQVTDIKNWTAMGDLPLATYFNSVVVTRNRLYVVGGYTGTGNAATSNVYTATIDSDGKLSGFTASASFAFTAAAGTMFVTKNRVHYVAMDRYGSGAQTTAYSAPINADGTLGAWVTGNALPVGIANSAALVTSSRVYLIGGNDFTNVRNTVISAPINADGTLGSWTTGTAFPISVSTVSVASTKNRVYVFGGYLNGTAESSAVYTAPINTDGTIGTWTATTSLPGLHSDGQAFVTKNRVFLLGRRFNATTVNTVYTAPINADGTLGSWTTGTSLPIAVRMGSVIATKNYIYHIGGFNGSNAITTIYGAPLQGGMNDYSEFYDGSYVPTDSTRFRLPDYSNREEPDCYYFVKA